MKGQESQPRPTSEPCMTEGVWKSNKFDMDNSVLFSHANPSFGSHGTGNTSHGFINHGFLLWSQIREQWVGSKRKSKQENQQREPKLSWNVTYESLLGSNKPFAKPVPLSRDSDSDDPGSAIDSYRRLYTDKNGNFVQDEPGRRYAEMVALRDAQSGVEEPLSDAKIMRQVLGPRPGWERGIGPKLPSSSQPPFQTQGSQRFFSQAEVEEMINTRMAEQEKKQQQQ